MVSRSTQDTVKKIQKFKERLELYYAQEKKMLEGGVQSYGIGTRNVERYGIDLENVRGSISEIEREIESLEAKSKRRAVGVIPKND